MAATRKTRSKIGVIGLGIIGTRVAANLRSAGHQVYVWSRTPRAAPNFLGSVVEVVDLCDSIQLFISDDAALREVIRTMAAALRPRHVVLCHATVSPAATRQAAGIVESQGARYLDAPFTGSKAAAQNRQLVYYVGGAKPALEEVRPSLEATSKAILHVGGIGDASVLKIATNMLTASTVQTLAEALALVRAAGIDGAKLVEALESNASRSGTSDLKLPAMIAANAEPNFSLKHMLKDVRFAQELADQYELSLPVTDTTAEVLALGMQNDWGDQDFSVVAQLYPVPAPVDAAPAPVPEPVSAPVEAAPAPVEKAAEPAAVETPAAPAPVQTPAAPTLVEKPAAVAEKLVADTVKSLAPISEDELAKLALPPRPTGPATPASPAAPASVDHPPDKVSAEKPASVPATLPGPDGKTDEPQFSEKQGAPAAADPPKKPEIVLPEAPTAGTAEVAGRDKKSTLQLVRNFFKPAPTEPR